MLKQFGNFIEEHRLIPGGGKVLLAVSGGMDSMVMAHLFSRINIPAAIAHCNFRLRGEESDADERFVRDMGRQMKMEVLVKSFDTLKEVDKRGGSVQMVARDLRFEWFRDLIKHGPYEVVATAHHLDDQIETFFINLFRGTGLSGLRGMLPKQDVVIHPMLFASRKQIEAFAISENIAYRTDTSNASFKYQRNQIRHQLMPVIEELAPDYDEVFKNNFELMREAENMLYDYSGQMEMKLTHHDGDKTLINKSGLADAAAGEEWLSFFLSRYGFHRTTAKNACQAMNTHPGKMFFSGSHRLLNDRDYFILEPISGEDEEPVYINEETSIIRKPVTMKFKKQPFNPNIVISSDKNIAMLDFDKLEFPLTVRRWKKGDAFYPLGMTGKKKVSDFFIDNKFSVSDKESTFFLVSGRKIAWVIGHRIDHRYRVTSDTQRILKIELFES